MSAEEARDNYTAAQTTAVVAIKVYTSAVVKRYRKMFFVNWSSQILENGFIIIIVLRPQFKTRQRNASQIHYTRRSF